MTRRERLRRVVILCAHFTRNLAYSRAARNRVRPTSPPFWITVQNNFIDTAVLEWCKLLADRKGTHSWKKVVSDSSRFECELLDHLGVTPDEYSDYIDELRTYRDKFLAHLDDLHIMNIPFLHRAHVAIEFYHRHIVQNEAAATDLAGLPIDLAAYYERSFEEAVSTYDGCLSG